MLRCPRCLSSQIYRAPTDSPWALLRRRMTRTRPHSCHNCGWHGWGEETGPKFTPEQIEMACRALTQPLDIAHDLGHLDLPNAESVGSRLRP